MTSRKARIVCVLALCLGLALSSVSVMAQKSAAAPTEGIGRIGCFSASRSSPDDVARTDNEKYVNQKPGRLPIQASYLKMAFLDRDLEYTYSAAKESVIVH